MITERHALHDLNGSEPVSAALAAINLVENHPVTAALHAARIAAVWAADGGQTGGKATRAAMDAFVTRNRGAQPLASAISAPVPTISTPKPSAAPVAAPVAVPAPRKEPSALAMKFQAERSARMNRHLEVVNGARRRNGKTAITEADLPQAVVAEIDAAALDAVAPDPQRSLAEVAATAKAFRAAKYGTSA